MALQPSRPGFMLAGALVVLVLPFLWASLSRHAVDRRWVVAGVVMALVFVALAAQYSRQARGRSGAPSAA